MSCLFRNVDERYRPPREIPVGDGTTPLASLKARAVCVDMETGPLEETLKSSIGALFDRSFFVAEDVSGAGNNWANGFHHHGEEYGQQILDSVQSMVETCDSLQSFFLLHSLGGGTGSGLGTAILARLEDAYPEVYRFTSSVFPSDNDDVITSPYNSVLACAQLVEHAHCVLPLDNAALMRIASLGKQSAPTSAGGGSPASGAAIAGGGRDDSDRGFDEMNSVAANVLLHLTSAMRFPGELNVDINEVCTNLLPYPRMPFLMAGISPAPVHVPPLSSQAKKAAAAAAAAASGGRTPHGRADVEKRIRARQLRTIFTDALSSTHQLIDADPMSGTVLASALLMRGSVTLSDVAEHAAYVQQSLPTVRWNEEGFKLGLCSHPPSPREPFAVLSLTNNTAMRGTLESMLARFNRLYTRRAMIHHYTQYMEEACFDQAVQTLEDVVLEYDALHRTGLPRGPAAPTLSDEDTALLARLRSNPVGVL